MNDPKAHSNIPSLPGAYCCVARDITLDVRSHSSTVSKFSNESKVLHPTVTFSSSAEHTSSTLFKTCVCVRQFSLLTTPTKAGMPCEHRNMPENLVVVADVVIEVVVVAVDVKVTVGVLEIEVVTVVDSDVLRLEEAVVGVEDAGVVAVVLRVGLLVGLDVGAIDGHLVERAEGDNDGQSDRL